MLAQDWSAAALADAALTLLDDPGLARRHVEALMAAGDRYSWEACGNALVRLFRQVLAQPKR